MKILKLLTSCIMVVAIIRSSEVTDIKAYHFHYRGLCAHFDIVELNNQENILEKSYQCGEDWDRIDKGIRRQIKDYEKDEQEKKESRDNEIRLQSIKNDQVGHVIQ